jgi:hypothetical protein
MNFRNRSSPLPFFYISDEKVTGARDWGEVTGFFMAHLNHWVLVYVYRRILCIYLEIFTILYVFFFYFSLFQRCSKVFRIFKVIWVLIGIIYPINLLLTLWCEIFLNLKSFVVRNLCCLKSV